MTSDSPHYTSCLQVLEKSPLFRELDSPALSDMLREFRHETLPRGARLSPTRLRERFSLLVAGRVEVTRSHPETGRAVTLFLLGPGDGFDVVTLLDGRAHGVTPFAVDPLELLSAPIAAVRDWIDAHPAFNRTFLPYLGAQMRSLEDLATDLALHDTVTRLGKLILRHDRSADCDRTDQDGPVRLINDLSHKTLARMIGSVRVVVNRHLQEWKRQGTLTTTNGRITVRDLDTLLRRCTPPAVGKSADREATATPGSSDASQRRGTRDR